MTAPAGAAILRKAEQQLEADATTELERACGAKAGDVAKCGTVVGHAAYVTGRPLRKSANRNRGVVENVEGLGAQLEIRLAENVKRAEEAGIQQCLSRPTELVAMRAAEHRSGDA